MVEPTNELQQAMTLRDPRARDRDDDDRIVRVFRGPEEWHARTSWHEQLFGPSAPDWFALEREPSAVVVKFGHARKTWRVRVGDRTVFAKVLDGGGFVGDLKERIGASAGRREWRAAREAQRRNVPAARCLAVGVCKGRTGRTAYLSEAVDGAVSLADAWARGVLPPGGNTRRAAAGRLIEAVARLYATAHMRGFVPRDNHAHNILVQTDTDGVCRAVFVDLHPSVVTRGAASFRRAAWALGQLDHYFQRIASGSERLRFLRSYAAHRRGRVDNARRRRFERRLIEAVAHARFAHAAGLARSRDRRLRRQGKYFASLALGTCWRARVTLALERRRLFPEADVPDRTEADWKRILAPLIRSIDGGRRDVEATVPPGIGVEVVRAGSVLDRVFWTLGGSPHRRAFDKCHRLRHRDLPTELILACAERRRRLLVDAIVLVRPRRPVRPAGKPVPPGAEVAGNARGEKHGHD